MAGKPVKAGEATHLTLQSPVGPKTLTFTALADGEFPAEAEVAAWYERRGYPTAGRLRLWRPDGSEGTPFEVHA